MSTVTTAVIMVSWHGGVTEEMMTGHNFRPPGHAEQSFGKMGDNNDGWVGGSKFPECDLYAAAFNYVPGPELEAWFRGLPWGDDGSAFLVWECNGETCGSASVGWSNL